MLDPGVVHLNHGSFGGCLRSVFEAAQTWRRKLEASPMRWFVLEWQAEGDTVVVRRVGRHSFEDVHRVLFARVPAARTLEEIDEGIRRAVRIRHARR